MFCFNTMNEAGCKSIFIFIFCNLFKSLFQANSKVNPPNGWLLQWVLRCVCNCFCGSGHNVIVCMLWFCFKLNPHFNLMYVRGAVFHASSGHLATLEIMEFWVQLLQITNCFDLWPVPMLGFSPATITQFYPHLHWRCLVWWVVSAFSLFSDFQQLFCPCMFFCFLLLSLPLTARSSIN